MAKIVVKQYGEKRTATCYVRHLLLWNFTDTAVCSNELGWKHGAPEDPRAWLAKPDHKRMAWMLNRLDDLRVVVTCKDPYAWLLSVMRFRGEKKDCLRATRKGILHARSLCDRYNWMYAVWLKFIRGRKLSCVIRYEDLLSDLKPALAKIGDALRLPRNPQFPKNVNEIMRPGERRSRRKFNRTRYYLDRDYMKVLPHRMRQIVSSRINWGGLKELGYEKA